MRRQSARRMADSGTGRNKEKLTYSRVLTQARCSRGGKDHGR